jgi:hypothetical protein
MGMVTEMATIDKCFIDSQKNLIIYNKLKKQSLFIELTNVYNSIKKYEKAAQLQHLKFFAESVPEKRILVGLGSLYGSKKILKEGYTDFCMDIKYEEKILNNVLRDLNGSMPILKKKIPLRKHHDRLYFDQQSVIDGLLYLNKEGDETLTKLLDPRYGFEKNLLKKLTNYINEKRRKCKIHIINSEKITNNIVGVIQGITLEDYIFKIFSENIDKSTFTYKRHGYNTNTIINGNENSTREIDIIVTGDKLASSLKNFKNMDYIDFKPKDFYDKLI